MKEGLRIVSPTVILFAVGFIDGLEERRKLISCGFGYFGFRDGEVTDYRERIETAREDYTKQLSVFLSQLINLEHISDLKAAGMIPTI